MDAEIRAMQGPTPGYVTKLQRLPPEIVHQILDRLPLYKVLNLLAHRTSYIAKCVLTHSQLKEIFRSLSEISRILDYFVLFRDIRIFCRQPVQELSVLALNYSIPQYSNIPRSDLLDTVIDKMTDDIRDHLRLDLHDIDLLRSSTDYPSPLDSAFQSLLNRWLWIKRAKKRMNAAKADQWNKAAELLTTYPTLLKKTLDPSQVGPRKNIAHITSRFRSNAKRCSNDIRLQHSRNRPCVPGVDLIELVPYDRYLSFFLVILQKYPPANYIDALVDSFYDVSLNLNEDMAPSSISDGPAGRVRKQSYQYASNILSDLQTAISGQLYIHTGSTLLVIPRFRWATPIRTQEIYDDVKVPQIFIDPKPHQLNLPEKFHRCPVRKQKPFDEREYQWLEAFAKVVTWMQEEFGADALEALKH